MEGCGGSAKLVGVLVEVHFEMVKLGAGLDADKGDA
jgi:hypothetical protein